MKASKCCDLVECACPPSLPKSLFWSPELLGSHFHILRPALHVSEVLPKFWTWAPQAGIGL